MKVFKKQKAHLKHNEGTFAKPVTSSNLVLGTKKQAFNAIFEPNKPIKSKVVVKVVVRNPPFANTHMATKLYKSISIVRCSPSKKFPEGEWYIQYYYRVPGSINKYKPVRTRSGLNRIHDLVEREQEAQFEKRNIKKWLDDGGMPTFAVKKHLELANELTGQEIERQDEEVKPKNWALKTAIAEFMKFVNKHGYAARTVGTYKCYVDDLTDWLTDAGLLNTAAYSFTELDLLPLLDEATANNDWQGRTFNNNLEFFGSFFNRCNKLEKKVNRNVRYEFDREGVDLKITTPQINKAYPPLLEKKIKEQLNLPVNEKLRDYIEWITLTLMRPREIRNLKIQDIDIESRHIRILGKTGDRLIPLSDQTLKLIEKKGLLSLDPSMYVFGRALSPSLERCSIQNPLEKYDAIRKKLKFEAVYKIYSWKPTAVIKMINAGFPDREIMVLTGHKTQAAFEKYKRDLVIDNSHAMKGSTIDF